MVDKEVNLKEAVMDDLNKHFKNRFDLEDAIMQCWCVTDDMEFILKDSNYSTEEVVKSLQVLYDTKFQKLWNIFEELIREQRI